MQPVARVFNAEGLDIHAQQWGEVGQRPVLALHGWLDNSASFSALAPLLRDVQFVALDMAGHGQSSHRPGTAPYNIWEDVAEVLSVADALGWQAFSLVGHSRGAIVAALLAGAFPDRVQSMVLIEGIFPMPVNAMDAPRQLAESILKSRELARKPLRVYASLEEAVNARARGLFPLSDDAARVLTRRGVKAVEGGYSWSTDQRLLAPSAFHLTKGQIHAFIGSIRARTRVVLAEDGLPRLYPDFRAALAHYSQLDVQQIGGGHHLHLEAQAPRVAALINDFIGEF